VPFLVIFLSYEKILLLLNTMKKCIQQNITVTYVHVNIETFDPLCRAYERGFSRYIEPGPTEPRRGLWISDRPHSLSHTRFI